MLKNGKAIVVTDSPKLLQLNGMFSGGVVFLQAYGNDFRYVTGADDDTELRTGAEVEKTPLSVDDAAGTYTLAAGEGEFYRSGEELLIYSDSDEYKGSVVITGIDSDTLTVSKVVDMVIEVDDKIITYSDPILVAGDIIDLYTKHDKTILIQCLSASTTENLIATLQTAGLKKKS